MKLRRFLPLVAYATLIAAPVLARPVFSEGGAPDAAPRPAALNALFDCRKLVDAERLICYDRQIAAFEDAERKRELVVVDRAEIQRTRRSLFGLTLPSLRLFGNGDKDAPAFQQIEARLKEVAQPNGRWLFTLDDGSTWLQSDPGDIDRRPQPGQQIRIRKGAMGSYMANVERQPALRVRRVN